MTRSFPSVFSLVIVVASLAWAPACTLFLAGAAVCDVDGDCAAGFTCAAGFCAAAAGGDDGEGAGVGEGEAEKAGEGEGEGGGEGEGEGEAPEEAFELVCGERHPVPPFFSEAYRQRQRIAFCDPDAPPGVVNDLPVTVVLTEDNFDFASAASDGSDVVFVDHRDGVATILPFERSVFEDGRAVFFVRVLRMNPSSQADSIFMYFDNPAAIDEEDVEATWGGHIGVWHFDDPQDALRETISGESAVARSQVEAVGDTPVGNGIELNAGRSSFVILPTPPGLNVSEGTISLVLGPANRDADPGIFANGCSLVDAPCGHVWLLGRAAGSGGFDDASMHLSVFSAPQGRVGVSRPPSSPDPFLVDFEGLAEQDFNVLSVSWTATAITLSSLRLEGGQVEHDVATIPAEVTPFAVSNFLLGIAEDNADAQRAGSLGATYDEVRVSDVSRNAAFLRAEAMAHLGRLLVHGLPEAGRL